MNELLDLLAEEVAHRLRAELQPQVEPSDRDQEKEVAVKRPQATGRHPELARSAAQHEPELDAGAAGEPESEALKQESRPEPPPAPTVPPHIARLLGRLALGLLALVIVINIPINRHGTTLATAMPDRRALVIRDGLVLKEEDDPEIYVYRNGRFRWISSLKAFEMRGYTWQDVHIVEDGFLESFETGPPIHVILKCNDSPHVYRLEGEKKRWIVDIESFEAEGYVWEDVEFVSCDYLRDLPDGKTIPPGHGPPPQP
ncbi:MAG: hypothetical protein PVH50_03440 [Anaerolineae bacterium]|jgi:hypothetical protein